MFNSVRTNRTNCSVLVHCPPCAQRSRRHLLTPTPGQFLQIVCKRWSNMLCRPLSLCLSEHVIEHTSCLSVLVEWTPCLESCHETGNASDSTDSWSFAQRSPRDARRRFEAAYVPCGRHNPAVSGSAALRCRRCSHLHHLSTLAQTKQYLR